nr:hypothetical protein [Tanacetum cinerariifolium]
MVYEFVVYDPVMYDSMVYESVYVDDIIITSNNNGTIDNIICQLGSAFALKDLGPLNYFLGIEIVSHVSDILLSQKKYILELLQSAGLSNCNLVSSPMVTLSSPSLDDSTAFSNPVKYRQVVGYLQYVTISRPAIAFAVNKVCQYKHALTENHWTAVKRILRYLHGTVEHGMLIRRSSGSTLQVFTDVLWKEAEYKALADTIAELTWLQAFLNELGIHSSSTPILWCDNLGATYLLANPIFHARAKHVEIDYHFAVWTITSDEWRLPSLVRPRSSHIGANADGFSSVHGGFGYGVRNEEGRTILEFAAAHDLVVANLFFKNRGAHLITFHSRVHDTQIDYMLVRKGDLRLCKYYKVFPAEVCFSQHRLLALDIHIKRRPRLTERAVKPESCGKTSTVKRRRLSELEKAAKETLGVVAGTLRTRIGRKKSWWISDEVQDKVKVKQTWFKELISMRGEDEANRSAAEEKYKEAKRGAKKAVARAKEKAYKDLYKRLDSKEGENDIYNIAKAKDKRKRDLGIVRFIKDRDGKSIVNEDALGEDGRSISLISSMDKGVPESKKWIVLKMGRNKAVGPDEILIKAWRCLRGEGVRWLTTLFNKTFLRAKIPNEWRLNDIVLVSEMPQGLNERLENKSDWNEEEEIHIGEHILEPKESFRYLGFVMHKSKRIEDDVTHRIQVDWLKVAIRPAMMYGSECWPLTKVQAYRMKVAEMRMLRWTCGKTLFDMIPNGVFRTNLQVVTIVNKMRERRLRWFGHVKRRPQSALVRRVESLTVD